MDSLRAVNSSVSKHDIDQVSAWLGITIPKLGKTEDASTSSDLKIEEIRRSVSKHDIDQVSA
jgi:hypothetical protein